MGSVVERTCSLLKSNESSKSLWSLSEAVLCSFCGWDSIDWTKLPLVLNEKGNDEAVLILSWTSILSWISNQMSQKFVFVLFFVSVFFFFFFVLVF